MNELPVYLHYLGPYSNDLDVKNFDRSDQSLDKNMFESFFGFSIEVLSEEMLLRYKRISDDYNYLPFVPYTIKLEERVLMPLKVAKKAFCVGDFIATIALCGLVSEMLTMTIGIMHNINDQTVTNFFTKNNRNITNSKFELLGQDDKLKLIRSLNYFTDIQEGQLFIKIKDIRKKYLHLWSQTNSTLEQDAFEIYISTVKLFKSVFGMTGFDQGKVIVKTEIFNLYK